jgi:hypothetical protein
MNRSAHSVQDCAMNDPREIVERQLAAYNARDLQGWLDTYCDRAEQVLADGTVLALGRSQLEERMRQRFADPRLHAVLVHRTVVGTTVIDHERVTRTGPNGLEVVEMVCMYSVSDGLIARATFAFGTPLREH